LGAKFRVKGVDPRQPLLVQRKGNKEYSMEIFAVGAFFMSVMSCLSVTLVYCGPTVRWIKIKPGLQVGLSPGHIVLELPSPKVYCPLPNFGPYLLWPMAGWIKMPLGMEVGLYPGDFVLDGDPAPPPQKGSRAPNFRLMFIMPKRLDVSRCHLVRRWASTQATLC